MSRTTRLFVFVVGAIACFVAAIEAFFGSAPPLAPNWVLAVIFIAVSITCLVLLFRETRGKNL